MSAVVADIAAGAAVVADLRGQDAAPAAGGTGDLSLGGAAIVPVVAGAVTLDASQADTFRVDLTADVAAMQIVGWPTGASRRIAAYLVQDATGGHAVTWPPTVKWSSGIAHTPSSAPGAIDCFVFTSFDGGATVFGSVVGLAYA